MDHGLGIVADAGSGGAHTSRTVMLRELTLLLAACPPGATKQDYVAAILEDNVLSKRSDSTRHRSLRYLRELYVLDPASPVFRTLRDLWCLDPKAQPLLALECALARDPLLRATAPTVLALPEGAPVDAAMLAKSVTERYPNSYSPPVAEKIGRNTASSWTQSGHVRSRTKKIRVRVNPRPPAVAIALFLGYLSDARGASLFETMWAQALDAPKHALLERAFAAAQRGLIEFRQAGDVVEVGFRWLLRPVEG